MNNNNNGLENITKYLLNYLFKKIDDLTAENQKLKLKLNIKAAEDRFLADIAEQAVEVAKKMGLIEEDDDNKETLETDDRKA